MHLCLIFRMRITGYSSDKSRDKCNAFEKCIALHSVQAEPMKEQLASITQWVQEGQAFALARVISTWGSAPRPIGSAMLIKENLEMAGSVSGGCVEGAVLKAAKEVLSTGEARRLQYGVTNEEAWGVGLSCGGKIQVFAEPFLAFDERSEEQAVWFTLSEKLSKNEACIFLTKIADGPTHHLLVLPDGSTIGHAPTDTLRDEALRCYRERNNQTVEIDGQPWFVQVFPRKSQLLIIGAAHITVDLVALAQQFGFETIVIDPRGVFTQKTQFITPPNQLIEAYPAEVLPDFTLDAYTYAVILSHDPKIDDNALHLLLRSEVGYIGALGSRKTHAKRVARLEEAGFSMQEIERIHAPIGVDIKAKTPREIALSIMAELIQQKNAFK
jgi:xanthine dehydrogenase accessory factor